MSLTTCQWLIRDVFRQARATGLTATISTCTFVAVLACASVQFHVPDGSTGTGTLSTLYGGLTVIQGESLEGAIHFLLFVLTGVVADTLGILLALIWTAGFLPSALDPSAASVILAKPVSRGTLLVGKFAGVIAYVAVQSTLFVTFVVTALGTHTGVWALQSWVCIPVLLGHFAVFFSVSALIAVSTRSTVACVVGSLITWWVCWGINYGRHALVGLEPDGTTAAIVRLVDVIYWVLPKPADFGLILYDALGADRWITPWVEFRAVQARGLFQPVEAVISSLVVAAGLLALTVYEFLSQDY